MFFTLFLGICTVSSKNDAGKPKLREAKGDDASKTLLETKRAQMFSPVRKCYFQKFIIVAMIVPDLTSGDTQCNRSDVWGHKIDKI